MKMQCEIIRDLIPLMEDDVCSEQSKKAVLEHIEECEECRRLYGITKNTPQFVLETEEKVEKEVLSKGFKKIKRRWRTSLLAVVCAIPILYLSWGQYQGRGFSFTNINEYMISRAFLEDLEKGDYEAAFEHLDLEPMKEYWLNDWFEEEKLENVEEDAKRLFCESATLLKSVGGIENPELLAIEEQINYYTIYYSIEVKGKREKLSVNVSDKGVISFNGNGRFLDDPVSHFGAWSEFLWEEYEGCYFDPVTHQYIYLE